MHLALGYRVPEPGRVSVPATSRKSCMTFNAHRYIAGATPAALLLVCTGLSACGDSSARRVASTSTARATLGVQQADARRGTDPKHPTASQALLQFAACVRRSGVDVRVVKPAGKPPVLDTNAIDTGTVQFKAAWARCRSHVDLGIAFHRPESSPERPGADAPPKER